MMVLQLGNPIVMEIPKLYYNLVLYLKTHLELFKTHRVILFYVKHLIQKVSQLNLIIDIQQIKFSTLYVMNFLGLD